jgi:transposase
MRRTTAADSADRQPAAELTRPILCEARRLRAAELLGQGRAVAEVAAAVGASIESVRRWRRLLATGGPQALRRKPAGGRPPKLDATQVARIEQALEAGAKANGFDTELWTLRRVAQVAERVTGVRLAPASVWRLLHQRLGWSVQRPQRTAKERDEQAIARWVAHEWPRIKKGRPTTTHG